jgi:hypothetical protein
MQKKTVRRLAALVLGLILVAPAAWAAPPVAPGTMLGSLWSALWSWGAGLRTDLGVSSAPDGRGSMSKGRVIAGTNSRGSDSTGTAANVQPSGSPVGGGGCGVGDCTNDGPDADPAGKR